MEIKKPKNLNNKGQRKYNKIPKIAIELKEPNYISKYRIDSFKLNLEELTEKEFVYKASEYFFHDLIYKKYFEVGELFTLNRNSSYKEIQKINILLEELKQNEYNSPRVIFFQNPPMIGISYITRYFNNNNFKFMLFNNSFGVDNNTNFKKYLNKDELFSEDYKDGSILSFYQRIFNIMRENRSINRDNNKTFFIVLKNLPYELFLMALKSNNFTPNFIKNWKSTILQLFNEIQNLLVKKESNVKLIFITDDKEIDEFELKTIFPKNLIDNPLTKNIICNPISKRRMSDILNIFLKTINPQIIAENNIDSFIESIYLEFNSNLQQILNHLLLKITSEFYHNKKEQQKILHLSFLNKSQTQKRITNIKKENNESQNKTKNKLNKANNKGNNKDFQIKKEKILDHDLFRLLGKLLYNKRYVIKNNSIEKLKKEEFGNNLETPRYYDINELINDIPISNNSFNELLIYNSIDHFNDIGEYSDTYDLYSFSDTIDNFNSFFFDKNNYYFHNNNYMKIYLNCLGVTTYNLSRYNNNKKFNSLLLEKGLVNIRKPDMKINKNINKFNDQMFYKACEYYPSLISLNIENFYKEGICDIFKKKCFNENNDNLKNNIRKNNNDENINYYYKEKVNKKFLESNEKEKKINRGNEINDNNTPKSNKLRNIPEEDQKALDSFFNENDNLDESQTESEIEE